MAPAGHRLSSHKAYIASSTTSTCLSLRHQHRIKEKVMTETHRKRETSCTQGFMPKTATAVDSCIDSLATAHHIHLRRLEFGDSRHCMRWSNTLAFICSPCAVQPMADVGGREHCNQTPLHMFVLTSVSEPRARTDTRDPLQKRYKSRTSVEGHHRDSRGFTDGQGSHHPARPLANLLIW